MLKLSDDLSFWNLRTKPFIDSDPMLKAVDSALTDYRANPTDNRTVNLSNALMGWKLTVEDRVEKAAKDPKNTAEARRGLEGLLFVIQKLDEELGATAKHGDALEALKQARARILERFQGKRFVVRKTREAAVLKVMGSSTKEVGESFKNAVQAAKQGGTPEQLAAILCPEEPRYASSALAGAQNWARGPSPAPRIPVRVEAARQGCQQVWDALTGNISEALNEPILTQAAKVLDYVAPILTLAKGGIKVGSKIVDLGKQGWTRYHKLPAAHTAILPGTPEAALDAVSRMIDKEMTETAVDFAKEGSKWGAEVAAFAMGGGGIGLQLAKYITGLLGSLGELCFTIYQFHRDRKEVNEVNQHLQSDSLDLSVFKVSPLLGCYVLACSNSSDIIITMKRFGEPGWNADLTGELKTKKLDPLIDKARELMRKSSYEIPELSKWGGHEKSSVFSRVAAP